MLIWKDSAKLKQYAACHRVWQGIPGIVRTPKGRVFLCFYSGNTTETYGNYCCLLRSDDGITFGEPIAVAEKEGKCRCFDPAVWIDPLGRLWLIWNVMPGDEVWAAICTEPDAEMVCFGEEFYIGRGVMLNKPTVLSDGAWLFPIGFWQESVRRGCQVTSFHSDDQALSFVYRTVDQGKTFEWLGGADIKDRTFDEHMVVERRDGSLLMMARTRNGMGCSFSEDGGRTWSDSTPFALPGPDSRFHLCRLRSGRLLLITHYRFINRKKGRNHLCALLSEDEGKSWPYSLLLDERDGVSYPDAAEGDDGFIDIVYDRERGVAKGSLQEAYAEAREIIVARITEQDILKGKTEEQCGSYLKRIACKLGTLAAEDPDPYCVKLPSAQSWAEQLLNRDIPPQEIITEVFCRYPLNCLGMSEVEVQSLDAQIRIFIEEKPQSRTLLTKIIRQARDASVLPSEENAEPIVQRTKQYIDGHLTEEIKNTELSRMLNISVYYLMHLFKRETGKTINQYCNTKRLIVAKRLLDEGTLNISEIALQTGFCTASYFTEVFSKYEGMTPTEYRKNQ
ncbi:MAG: exo-alpha-sialidase [Clostridia bacterium]|nr:exo-alpha-sialidase [Clostridia bacterium]